MNWKGTFGASHTAGNKSPRDLGTQVIVIDPGDI
jgi:hypothetical protein